MNLAELGKVVCLIPAFNEGERVGVVVRAVLSSGLIQEVVVVDDGSSDDTAAVAEAAGASVIKLVANRGKGGAVQAGIEGTEADTYIFMDADLLGLKPNHFAELLSPLALDRDVSVVTGVCIAGRLRVDLAQRLFSSLNGQKALRSDFVDTLPDLSEYGWGIETVIHEWVQKGPSKGLSVPLYGLSQVMKEEKQGFTDGVRSRVRMYREVLEARSKIRRMNK